MEKQILNDTDIVEILQHAKRNYVHNFNLTTKQFVSFNETLLSSILLYTWNTHTFIFENNKIQDNIRRINKYIKLIIPRFTYRFCTDDYSVQNIGENWIIDGSNYKLSLYAFDKLLKIYGANNIDKPILNDDIISVLKPKENCLTLFDVKTTSNFKIKHTSETFIEKIKKFHGNKYLYDKVNFVNMRTKVTLICPIHKTEFDVSPYCLTSQSGIKTNSCPECKKLRDKSKYTFDNFVDKARNIHGNKYEYIEDSFVSMSGKIKIVCSKHGEFEQNIQGHLKGSGCPVCTNHKAKLTIENVKQRLFDLYGNKYEWDLTEYENIKSKIKLICSEHGESIVNCTSIFNGNGCPLCIKERRKSKTKTTEFFIEKSMKIHGTKYDYSKVDYKGYIKKVTIICPEHGEFEQYAQSHLSGRGCSKCNKCGRGKKK